MSYWSQDLPYRCWICGTEYVEECPQCGPPMPLGRVQADYERVLQLEAEQLAADDKRERDETDYSDDDDYARDVCVPRWGPL